MDHRIVDLQVSVSAILSNFTETLTMMQVSSFQVLYDGQAIANSTGQLTITADASGGLPVTASTVPALQPFTVAGSEVKGCIE